MAPQLPQSDTTATTPTSIAEQAASTPPLMKKPTMDKSHAGKLGQPVSIRLGGRQGVAMLRPPGGKLPSGVNLVPVGMRRVDTKQVIDEANIDKFKTVTTKMKDMSNLLETATDDDKTLVLFELQQVLVFARDFVLHNILPVICTNAAKWTEAVQVPAAEALSAVLIGPVSSNLAKLVCKVACDVIRSANDQANRELWGEVLARALPYGSWSGAELEQVVDQLQTRAGGEKISMTSKLTARILGSMAISSVDNETKKVLLHRAIAMSEDHDEEVRGIIADSMGYIGAALDIVEVERDQWPSLQRLSQDNNACVQAACLRTISVISGTHKGKTPDAKLFKYLLPPLFYKECSRLRRAASQDLRSMDEDLYLIVEINSEIFGRMLKSCFTYMPDEISKKEVYKAFLAMATCNSPIIRKNCAANMPLVAECMHEKYGTFLIEIVDYLSHDANDETRWTLASRLHETLKYLANRDSIAQVFKAVLVLLRDKNWLVRQNVMHNFQMVVAELSKYCTYDASGKMSSLFEQLQLLCDGNWRVQELLVRQLQLSAPFVPPTSMMVNVLPMLYRISREGTYTVRKVAMGAIATYIRSVPDGMDRARVMKTFCDEWGRGPIYWMRIGFIDAAKYACALYSRCLFRDTFGMEVLKLAHDSVSNVRLRVAILLPAIAPACYQLEEFQPVVDVLKKDSVCDIQEVALKIEEKIEKSLMKARENFEEDMILEDEERELYSRHLQNRREANKKKSNLKKAAGGWWHGKASKSTSPSKGDEVESATSPSGKAQNLNSGSSNQGGSVDDFHSADWSRTDAEPLYSTPAVSKDDADLLPARTFKGLRPFRTGKASATNVKKGTRRG